GPGQPAQAAAGKIEQIDAAAFAAGIGLECQLFAIGRVKRARVRAAIIGDQQAGLAAVAGHGPDAAIRDEGDLAAVRRYRRLRHGHVRGCRCLQRQRDQTEQHPQYGTQAHTDSPGRRPAPSLRPRSPAPAPLVMAGHDRDESVAAPVRRCPRGVPRMVQRLPMLKSWLATGLPSIEISTLYLPSGHRSGFCTLNVVMAGPSVATDWLMLLTSWPPPSR